MIDYKIVSRVLLDIFNISKTEGEIKHEFYSAALKMSSDVIREMIAFRLNLFLRPQDFSIPKIFNNTPYFDSAEGGISAKEKHREVLATKFVDHSKEIHSSLMADLSQESIEKIVYECEDEVKESLESDGWLSLFPGKELIESVAKKFGIANTISFQNSIIKEFASDKTSVDQELLDIFNLIGSS